jgi:hypothetical protein
MKAYFRAVGIASLPVLAMLVGSGGAIAGSPQLWLFAQNTEQNQPGTDVPAQVPQQPQAEQPAPPPGGAQDEPGGVEADVSPPASEMQHELATRPPQQKYGE